MQGKGERSSSLARRNINLAERKVGIQRAFKIVGNEGKGTIYRGREEFGV